MPIDLFGGVLNSDIYLLEYSLNIPTSRANYNGCCCVCSSRFQQQPTTTNANINVQAIYRKNKKEEKQQSLYRDNVLKQNIYLS